MKYKGYVAEIRYDEKTDCFHGDVLNVHAVITFQGNSTSRLLQEFKKSINEYFAVCLENSIPIEKPFKDAVSFRICPRLRRDVLVAAKKKNMTMNAWIEELLQNSVG